MIHSFKYICVLCVIIIILIINCSYNEQFQIYKKATSDIIIPFLDSYFNYNQYKIHIKNNSIEKIKLATSGTTKFKTTLKTIDMMDAKHFTKLPPLSMPSKIYSRTFINTNTYKYTTIVNIGGNVLKLTYNEINTPKKFDFKHYSIQPGKSPPIITYDNYDENIYYIVRRKKIYKYYILKHNTPEISKQTIPNINDSKIYDAYIFNKHLYILLIINGECKIHKYKINDKHKLEERQKGTIKIEQSTKYLLELHLKGPKTVTLLISKNNNSKDIVYILINDVFHTYFLDESNGKGRQNKITANNIHEGATHIVYLHDITRDDELRYIIRNKKSTL